MSSDDKFGPKSPSSSTNPEVASSPISERRMFFKEAGFVGLGVLLSPVSAATAAQSPPAGAPVVTPPVQTRVIENTETALPDGSEHYMVFEVSGSNQVTSVNKTYTRRVDTGGDSYVVFVNCSISWYPPGTSTSSPAQWLSVHSSIVSGQKGPVEGNQRKDTLTMATIYGDGVLHKTGPMTVAVWLTAPPDLASMPFQDRMNYFMKNKHFKQN